MRVWLSHGSVIIRKWTSAVKTSLASLPFLMLCHRNKQSENDKKDDEMSRKQNFDHLVILYQQVFNILQPKD